MSEISFTSTVITAMFGPIAVPTNSVSSFNDISILEQSNITSAIDKIQSFVSTDGLINANTFTGVLIVREQYNQLALTDTVVDIQTDSNVLAVTNTATIVSRFIASRLRNEKIPVLFEPSDQQQIESYSYWI